MGLREDLIRQEGWKKFPYKDTKGIWTIGVGHNMEADKGQYGMAHFTKLQAEGMTDEEIGKLLTEDILEHQSDVLRSFSWASALSYGRLEAMINLTFNMGLKKLSQFKRFLRAMEEGSWEEAVKELLYTGENKTPYYVQVGKRAEQVARQILEG